MKTLLAVSPIVAAALAFGLWIAHSPAPLHAAGCMSCAGHDMHLAAADSHEGHDHDAAASSAPASEPASKPAVGAAVNTRCPIMGGKVDPKTVPASLTRQYKGKTIGFCCGGCPPQWDKLSDEEKDKKLEAITK